MHGSNEAGQSNGPTGRTQREHPDRNIVDDHSDAIEGSAAEARCAVTAADTRGSARAFEMDVATVVGVAAPQLRGGQRFGRACCQ
jgi:hypothetical protein